MTSSAKSHGGLACLVLSLMLMSACGDDSAVTDAGTDASNDDADSADAGPCGADLYYQIEVFDWSSNMSVPNSEIPGPSVTATIIGEPGSETTIAPNGRVTFCLSRDEVHRIEFVSDAEHWNHIEVVDTSAYSSYLSATQNTSYRVYMLTAADLDALATGESSPTTGNVFVHIQGDNSAFTASIDAASESVLVGEPGQSFVSGDTTDPDNRWIAFRNVGVDTDTTSLTITGGLPCAAPSELDTVANKTTAALAVCFVGP